MAEQRTKLQTYTQLAADNSAVITSSFENWTQFLATAARLYNLRLIRTSGRPLRTSRSLFLKS